MFGSVSYEYNDKDNSYTFTGWLGLRFRSAITKIGYTESKQKYLFNNIGLRGFTVSSFFITDIRYICESLLVKGSVFNVNLHAIEQIIDIIDNKINIGAPGAHNIDFDLIEKSFKYSPLKSQLPAYDAYTEIRSINGSRGMLLDGAVGVGKTYISLSIAVGLRSEVTLIVVPLPTVERVWLNSLSGDDCLYHEPQRSYLIGSSKEYTGEQYVIAHYENLDKILPLRNEYNINFSTLIVDEVHNFNNIKSARTKLLMDVVDTIPFKHTIPMSGTPIKARPKDLLPLLKIINTDFTNKIMNRFVKLYKGQSSAMLTVLKERYSRHTVVIKKSSMDIPPINTYTIKNKITNGKYYTLESISTRMRKYMEDREAILEQQYPKYEDTYTKLYNRAKDILLTDGVVTTKDINNYEDNVRVIIRNYNRNSLIAIPDEIQQANLFEKKFIEPLLQGDDKRNFREAKTVYKYIKLKVQGEALANVVMKARIDCYTELANRKDVILNYVNSSTKKTIIFSNFISVCEAVVNRSLEATLEPISIFGKDTKFLTKNVNIFTNNVKSNPLVTTYKSLSTGVPLIVANVILIFGLPYRQYVFEQTIGRVWRTGQDTPVTVYIVELDTDGKPNITDRDFDIITFFREEVAKLTGNTEAVVIERNASVASELNISNFMISNDNVLSKLLRTTVDTIKNWR